MAFTVEPTIHQDPTKIGRIWLRAEQTTPDSIVLDVVNVELEILDQNLAVMGAPLRRFDVMLELTANQITQLTNIVNAVRQKATNELLPPPI